MEGTKFLASQAKSIYRYKGLRSKILKCNADIFFNKKMSCQKYNSKIRQHNQWNSTKSQGQKPRCI
jgi:hypothetical protein